MNNFHINEDDILLQSAFSGKNYLVINGMAKNRLCIVFCSGNGLWYPDTDSCFRDIIISNDRYEWRRTASHVVDYAERIIFIRDLHKCWYASGISEEIDSIDKLVDLLKALCRGFHVVVTGNSAGGYIASLLGYKLDADFVLNWSGQCNIWKCDDVVRTYHFVKKYINDISRSCYYDIVPVLKDNSVPIYYFHPEDSEQDAVQYKEWLKIPNVFPIAIKSKSHGQGVGQKEYFTLLLSEKSQLQDLYQKCIEKSIELDKLEHLIDELPMAKKYYEFDKVITSTDKVRFYRDLLLKWVSVKQCGENIFLHSRFKELTKFAIYGRGGVFDLLRTELNQAGKKVSCIVESSPASNEYNGVPVISPVELNNDVDAVVIIPYYDKEKIYDKIKKSAFVGQVFSMDGLV